MRNRLTSWLSVLLLSACAVPGVEGGNNGNDRTNGGEQGEVLWTGAMTVATSGKWALMQRNETSVLFDVEGLTAREMPTQVARFVFATTDELGFAVLRDGSVVAHDLRTLEERWRTRPAFDDPNAPSLARLSEGDRYLVLGDGAAVFVLDAATGATRARVALRSPAAELSFVPGTQTALIVGTTRWHEHQPATEVAELDLETLELATIDVPNCTAPIAVLPDGSRAFLSPTFCEEGRPSTEKRTWTNPDPVSVIDRTDEGPLFVKNLPGFGPVALAPDGNRVIAYLDVQRMDASLFDDPTQVPSTTGPRYHVMSIDPQDLSFALFPVGDLLPRFALARDGETLLVDATVQQVRGDVSVKATVDSNGRLNVKVRVFGAVDSLFGALDLSSGVYTPFSGAAASLDRFVQMGDAKRVFTLKLRPDGMGGDLYRIDLESRAATSLGKSLRDLGLLADGETLLLRQRLSAVRVETKLGFEWYRRERYCLSLDGVTCRASIDFQDSKPFQSGPNCTSYHDC